MEYLKPSFIIIGERKCGTSSLYRYLLTHPQVLPCQVKEPQFFNKSAFYIWWNIHKYYRLFPKKDTKETIKVTWPELDKAGKLYEEILHFHSEPGGAYITGEASANTFFEVPPQRLKRYLPNIKLILLLREPAERAYSHYRMLKRFKAQGRKGPALTNFKEDLYEAIRVIQNGGYSPFLSPSLYANRLKNWLQHFDREAIMVIAAEELKQKYSGQIVMNELCKHLSIKEHDFSEVLENHYNVAPKSELPLDLKQHMQSFFVPHNARLNHLLNRTLYL